jgi:type IV pilus assembly protein PilA
MRHGIQRGFTLLELMIVVVILGVLAAIAVMSFMGQFQQAKTSEVQALLRDVAAKQEAYRAEFGQYLNVSGAMAFGNKRPSAAPKQDFGYVAWDPGPAGDPIGDGWRRLGFAPQSAVRYGYVVTAGLPGQDPTGFGVPAGLVASSDDHWWAAVAYGNLDLDAPSLTTCSQHYISSTQNIMGVVNGTE